MTERKWTPGPWVTDGFGGILAYGSCDTIDCSVLGRIATAEDVFDTDSEGRNWWAGGDKKANAHLIAAAPELYKALEMAALWLDVDGRFDLQVINAALAKARGEE